MTRPQRFRLWIPGAILAALIGIALPAAAETIFVSSNGVGVTSSPLIAGQMYLFTVSGTYTYTSGGNGADAEFSDAGEFYPGFGRTNDTLDLLLDGTAVEEHDEVREDRFPIRKVKAGGWSQPRYQHRAEKNWET